MSKQKSVGKRGMVLAIMILVLGAAVYLNWQINQSQTPTKTDVAGTSMVGQAVYVDSSSVTQQSNYFTKARLEREESRKKATEALKEVINNVKADANEVAAATADAAEIAKNIEKESNMETLIKAKGFADCIVVISGDSASVVVQTNGLLPSDTMQITEIVQTNSEISAENIKIIEVK